MREAIALERAIGSQNIATLNLLAHLSGEALEKLNPQVGRESIEVPSIVEELHLGTDGVECWFEIRPLLIEEPAHLGMLIANAKNLTRIIDR